MTTTSSEEPRRASSDGPGVPDGAIAPEPARGRMRRLMFSIFGANLGIFILWGAIPGILLPLQVQAIDPVHKAEILAIVSTVGAFVAMLAQPIAGTLSDRTRSRLGRRAPWMLGGVLIGGLALVGMSLSNGIVQLAVAWMCVQISYNFVQGPLSAIMPDRVPRAVRGTFAAFTGLGTMLGALGGQIVGAQFAARIGAGYVFFAGLALVVIVLFVVFNPDRSNRDEPRTAFSTTAFLKTFWVSPRRYPDFFWGFLGRLLLFVGYFLVSGYQLYILQDYVGLGGHAISAVPLVGLVSLVGIIVSTLIAGPLSDRLGRRKIFAVAAGVIMAIALLIPWAMPSLLGMLAYALVSGLGFGAYQAVDSALMSEVLPSRDDFAKDLGVLNIAATLPQTIAPAAAGAIVLAFHSYVGLFPIGIVIALAGAFAVIPIKSVR